MEFQEMVKTALITDITGVDDACLAEMLLKHGYAAFYYHELRNRHAND